MSLLKSLLERFNTKKLYLNQCRFSKKGMSILCDLIRTNSSLTFVDFSSCELSCSKLINALQFNSVLQKVNLSNNCIAFDNLLSIYKLLSDQKLNCSVIVTPHFVDVSTGSIQYENEIEMNHLLSLLKVSNSNVPIKRVFCRGLTNSNITFRTMIALSELFSINKSLLDVDLSPHFIDIEEGVLSFCPNSVTDLSIEEFIKKLTLKGCRFSESITVLCDLIRANQSLSSISLTHCGLSNNNLLSLCQVLQCSKLAYLNFSNNSIGNQGVLALSEVLKVNETISSLNLTSNSIGAEGARALSEVLKVNSVITKIDLTSNSVGNEGAKAFVKAVSENSLCDVYIGNNSIHKKDKTTYQEFLF
ncbi:hypothetical protein GEMRC1_012499 [Eukaryota sp. GEM-RC1]